MQSNYVNETTGTSYLYGIDRVGGLFVTKITEEETINFTQFSPYHSRFTYTSVIENIPSADLEVLKITPIGDYKVVFDLTSRENYNGKVPKELLKHYRGKHDFFAKTWGELFELMSYFNDDLLFYEMTLVCQSVEDGSMGRHISWENEFAVM